MTTTCKGTEKGASEGVELRAEEVEILSVCDAKHRAAKKAPAPPQWHTLDSEEWQAAKKHGPRYSPGIWFNNGRAVSQKIQSRYYRAVRRLVDRGLLSPTFSSGGVLQHLKLTAEGASLVKRLAQEKAEHDQAGPRKGKAS